MKNTLVTLPLSLIFGLFASSVFATTGTINFQGKITAVSCGIEVVDPETGAPGAGRVNMGSVEASRFTAAGQEYGGKGFILRVIPGAGGCTIAPDSTARVTFTGAADPSGVHYAFKPTTDAAKGVVAVIKDKSGTNLGNGSESAEYNLAEKDPTDMRFDVYYRSTAEAVSPGPAEADVAFVVAIN
jgi:major type 1 subunit fimbrin (pilin)